MRSRFVGKKRFIILFFMLLCSMCIISMGIKSNVSSAKIKSGVWKVNNKFFWTYDTKTKVLKIKGSGWMPEPGDGDAKGDTPGWAYKAYEAEKVIMSGNMKNVGVSCFEGFKRLKTVVLPETIVEIGCSAFEETYSLKKINFPKKLKTIKSSAFWDSGIERIIIPKRIVKINKACFFCSGLKTIKLNENIKCIEDAAFRGIHTLENIKLTPKLNSIGATVFAETSINNITIPRNVTKIGNYLFCRDKKIRRVVVNTKKLKKIGKELFFGTKQNITIEVPKKKYKEYKKMFLKNPGNKNVKVVVGKSL